MGDKQNSLKSQLLASACNLLSHMLQIDKEWSNEGTTKKLNILLFFIIIKDFVKQRFYIGVLYSPFSNSNKQDSA